jgi:hypothetical protein
MDWPIRVRSAICNRSRNDRYRPEGVTPRPGGASDSAAAIGSGSPLDGSPPALCRPRCWSTPVASTPSTSCRAPRRRHLADDLGAGRVRPAPPKPGSPAAAQPVRLDAPGPADPAEPPPRSPLAPPSAATSRSHPAPASPRHVARRTDAATTGKPSIARPRRTQLPPAGLRRCRTRPRTTARLPPPSTGDAAAPSRRDAGAAPPTRPPSPTGIPSAAAQHQDLDLRPAAGSNATQPPVTGPQVHPRRAGGPLETAPSRTQPRNSCARGESDDGWAMPRPSIRALRRPMEHGVAQSDT